MSAADPWADFSPTAAAPAAADPWADFLTAKPGVAGDMAKSGGVGLVKGAAGLAGMIGDIPRMIHWGADAAAQAPGRLYNRTLGDGSWDLPESARAGAAAAEANRSKVAATDVLPGGDDVVRAIEGQTGPLYKPQTVAGEYARTVGEFLPAAMAGPGGVARKALAFGVAPALTSETAGQMTKGTAAEPYARIGTALATGGVAALASAPRYADRLVARAAGDVTPQQFQAAEALMRDAQARGVQLTVDEALQAATNGATRMGDVRRVVESTTEGAERFAPVMAQRPGQMQAATDAALDRIAPRSAQPSFLGPQMQEAGQGALDRVRQNINRLSEPYYTAASTMPIPRAEYQQLMGLPGYPEALAAVRGNPQLNRMVSHLPDESVGVLNEVKKQLDTLAQNAQAAASPTRNMQAAAGYSQDARSVNNMGRTLSPEYGQALDIQAQARSRALAPLEAGPVGQMAQTDDFVTQGRALMGDRPSVQEVTRATGNLAAENPQATRGLVREHVGRVADRTVGGLDTMGRPDQFGGAKLARELRGNSREAQNIDAAIREAAGVGPSQDVSRLVDVLQATGWRQRPGSLTAFNQEAVGDMKRGGVSAIAQALMKPLATGKDAVSRARLGSQANRLAEALLAGPDGVRRVQDLAAQGTGAREALARLLLTTSGATNAKP